MVDDKGPFSAWVPMYIHVRRSESFYSVGSSLNYIIKNYISWVVKHYITLLPIKTDFSVIII